MLHKNKVVRNDALPEKVTLTNRSKMNFTIRIVVKLKDIYFANKHIHM
jgi:hypothetical protein